MYFNQCQNLDELKALYKKLALKNHPDMGGDLRIMQEINAEYEKRFESLKNAHNETSERKTTETPQEFIHIVDKIINIEGIEIELCGSWLWVSGNTYEAKDQLKAAGFKWSKNKKKWHWHHAEDGDKWSRGRATMEEIRLKYGSELLTSVNNRVALPA